MQSCSPNSIRVRFSVHWRCSQTPPDITRNAQGHSQVQGARPAGQASVPPFPATPGVVSHTACLMSGVLRAMHALCSLGVPKTTYHQVPSGRQARFPDLGRRGSSPEQGALGVDSATHTQIYTHTCDFVIKSIPTMKSTVLTICSTQFSGTKYLHQVGQPLPPSASRTFSPSQPHRPVFLYVEVHTGSLTTSFLSVHRRHPRSEIRPRVSGTCPLQHPQNSLLCRLREQPPCVNGPAVADRAPCSWESVLSSFSFLLLQITMR